MVIQENIFILFLEELDRCISNLLFVNGKFLLLKDASIGLFIVLNILKNSDIIHEINNQQITIKYTHSFSMIK